MKAKNTHGRRISILLASAVAVASVGLVQPVTANAQSPDADAVSTAEDVANVAGVADGAALSSTDDGFEVELGVSDVTIPSDASGAITIDSGEGAVGLGIPGGATADGTLVGDQVVYSDVAVGTNIVAQATVDGGAQILITIDSAAAPTTFDFPVSVPSDARLQSNPDGSIDVIKTATDASGVTSDVIISSVAPAWATDANGAPVSTHYTVNGNTITQTVDHNASTAYPVVADPWYKPWTWNRRVYNCALWGLAGGIVAISSAGTTTPGVVAAVGAGCGAGALSR
ncbi:hypothetical protein [Ilumatobacter sp.]